MKSPARRLASVLGFASLFAGVLVLPAAAHAQSQAVQSYAPNTVDVGWASGPGSLFGPGFTFTPTTDVFATALSFFNSDANGGAQGFSVAGDPSFATMFTVVLAQVNTSGNATALAWASVDGSSPATLLTTGGITGAFFSAVLATPYALHPGQLYSVFASNDQGLITVGAGWDTGITPPNPTLSPLLQFGNYIAGASTVSSLGVEDGITVSTAPNLDLAFSTGASLAIIAAPSTEPPPVTATPEPLTLTLVATGFGAVTAIGRRRRGAGAARDSAAPSAIA